MNEFQKYLSDEFVEDYREGRISRRKALQLIASVTGSLVMANTLLAACGPADEAPATATGAPPTTAPPQPTNAPASPTEADATAPPEASATTEPEQATSAPDLTVGPEAAGIEAGPLEFPGEGATLMGYLARPASGEALPVVLVCHENRGLTDHIADVTRRLAMAGYVGLAVDLLSRQGGTAAVGADAVPGALGNTSPDQFVSDFLSGWRYLREQPFANADRVGMVGFCFGGGVTWLMATRAPELLAAVPFYGPHPPVSEVPNIQAAVLAIYGELDARINSGIPAIEAAMQESGKTYEKVIYPGADHAFHNDTGQRYNAEAASDAWSRTLDWFATYLRA